MDYFTAVKTFTRVVETGSFAKAADSLEVPRNMVTKLVQSLEAHLRVKLLNRTTRRVSMTNDGAAYYERMSRLMEEWLEVESDLASAQSNPRGRLRVDMGATLASFLVIPALASFHARYPDLQLDIGVSDRPVDLISDRIDCVVRAGKVTDPSLIARHIGDLPFVTCAAPGYMKGREFPEHPADLERGHTLIRYFFAGSGRQSPVVLNFGDEQATLRGRHFVSVNDTNALLAAGLAELGILHLPAFAAQSHIEAGRLVSLLDNWTAEPVPISIVYSANRHLSSRVRVFVDWMVELFKSNAYAIIR
ncbi:LysR family transcriptional regulator [Undibacterium terreum]|uniref:LysR family transcriptional regulator n=1 Tax=Undibacterium terreum TaxID=1224302 RepID=A0A916UQ99_9BURK|nr:LysR family transcriptional regulator [Undibacterium terreum]GGC81461.1 LysR family transcriptional regulator [Undibacterium terreum]